MKTSPRAIKTLDQFDQFYVHGQKLQWEKLETSLMAFARLWDPGSSGMEETTTICFVLSSIVSLLLGNLYYLFVLTDFLPPFTKHQWSLSL